MIPFIYYKLKHIFRMFYNKVYFMFDSVKRSSIFYKTSARHTWHKTTQVRHEEHKCDTSETKTTKARQECNRSTSATAAQVWNE